ncbi:SDR family oxidoreductase (plasmid) [Rhodococcus sp. USK10]|uniref:3-oxoacyl-[acyl-carrier-protein] reductase MabA n=1 Tax=Rhodococcus opacus TaxID=37919 RepID=A0AAX3YQ52_RHOOP|nr:MULTISPECIES: SDR family NAD(P)-dependent oxidoreductase [Rhodococcus]MCZ4590279.1 SDR family NAD(P)-dependent oxidoreductase [Rhodococcus opacus]QYB00345.1 SDR family oxidoreductase [Rhodococcus sp. USK10]WLF51612.1 SDR family NAD(P)-dependent oxidoreductase [Rhodococcus opacus]WLF52591.1 SDR family NAD(P)-dependent oxidoreductase [Rhodococcus opacus]
MGNINYDFTGRTVIVTGAARGIGLEVAKHFNNSGADVVMVDFDGDEVKQAAETIDATAVQADVSNTDDVERVVNDTVKRTGRIDVIVNNAGILRDRVLWKLTDEDWAQVLDVHAGGSFRFTRAVVPHFRAQNYGRIINVTSYSGIRGNRGQANYSTAKAGIIGLTKTSAKELAAFGITVNAISPNAATRMTASIPDEKVSEVTGPIARFADPAEMANAIAFLASEEAGYITGVVLPVDGGVSM